MPSLFESITLSSHLKAFTGITNKSTFDFLFSLVKQNVKKNHIGMALQKFQQKPDLSSNHQKNKVESIVLQRKMNFF